MTKSVIVVLGAFRLTACQTVVFEDYRALCGWKDERPWRLVRKKPNDIVKMRELADLASREDMARRFFAVESWFSLPDGQIMLCRTETSPTNSCEGEWWQFSRKNGQIIVTDSSAWVCVT